MKNLVLVSLIFLSALNSMNKALAQSAETAQNQSPEAQAEATRRSQERAPGIRPMTFQGGQTAQAAQLNQNGIGFGFNEGGPAFRTQVGFTLQGNDRRVQQSNIGVSVENGTINRFRASVDAVPVQLWQRTVPLGVTGAAERSASVTLHPLNIDSQLTVRTAPAAGASQFGPSHVYVAAPVRFEDTIRTRGFRYSGGYSMGTASGMTCNGANCRGIPIALLAGADLTLTFGVTNLDSIRLMGGISTIVAGSAPAGYIANADLAWLHRLNPNGLSTVASVSVEASGQPGPAVSDATVRDRLGQVYGGYLNIGVTLPDGIPQNPPVLPQSQQAGQQAPAR